VEDYLAGKPLHTFLVRVAENEGFVQTWLRDGPDALLKEADSLLRESGVTDEQRERLRDGDLNWIRDALAAEVGFAHSSPWVVGGKATPTWVLIKG
jgi:hypothetical protein